MPLGVGLAIGVVGGAVAGKAFGGSKSTPAPAPQQNTTGLTDAASKNTPPSAVQGASDATAQANVAAMKQRKKAAAGDTLLTPQGAPGASGKAATPTPASLIGSK